MLSFQWGSGTAALHGVRDDAHAPGRKENDEARRVRRHMPAAASPGPTTAMLSHSIRQLGADRYPERSTRERGRRSIGTTIGDEPAWTLPSTSKPWR
jgi:hypothetical protein